MKSVILAVVVAFLISPALAQTKAPSVQEQQYQAKIDKARSAYWQEVIATNQAYADQLKQELDKALTAKNLELAKSIEARRTAVLAEIATARQGQATTRPKNEEAANSNLVLKKAVYGSQKARVDVTQQVRGMMRNGNMELTNMGGNLPDPDYGQRKILYVHVVINGKEVVMATAHQGPGFLFIGSPDVMPKENMSLAQIQKR